MSGGLYCLDPCSLCQHRRQHLRHELGFGGRMSCRRHRSGFQTATTDQGTSALAAFRSGSHQKPVRWFESEHAAVYGFRHVLRFRADHLSPDPVRSCEGVSSIRSCRGLPHPHVPARKRMRRPRASRNICQTELGRCDAKGRRRSPSAPTAVNIPTPVQRLADDAANWSPELRPACHAS